MNREFGGGSSQACASCKHQRKRCDENCELAPYFPANRYREFQNAHKLFGVSNIQKIISSVEPHQRQAAAESILMEGNMRYNNPVHGCLGVVQDLKSQIHIYEKELGAVNHQLAFFREREKQQQFENFLKSSSVAVPPPLAPSPSMFNYEAEGFNFQRPPNQLPNIGDMNIGERMYNYQSTMEESAGVQPFDIQAIDQILDPYQTGQTLSSLDHEPGNSSARSRGSGKQPSESVSDEEAESVDVPSSSSLKGKKHIGH